MGTVSLEAQYLKEETKIIVYLSSACLCARVRGTLLCNALYGYKHSAVRQTRLRGRVLTKKKVSYMS